MGVNWLNYYERHLGDYARDTGHLSQAEHGAYTLLLDRYYATERPIQAGIAYGICRAGTRAERAAVDAVLQQFFRKQSDGWAHQRVEEEIVKVHAKSQRARDAAAKRWQCGGNANASETQQERICETHPLQSPVTRHQAPSKEIAPGKPAAAPTTPVWESYANAFESRNGVRPLRNAKANALLANFLKQVPGDEAPGIAAFYVTNNLPTYVIGKHPLELLLRDAQKLRAEWVTGQQGNSHTVRQNERTAANPFALMANKLEAIGNGK